MTGRVEELQDALNRSEQALQRSEARFRAIIERSTDGILIVSHDGTIRFANRAAGTLLGSSPAALVGESFCFSGLAGETTEIDLIQPQGGHGTAEMQVMETEWEEEPVYLVSLRNITARKQAEEAQAFLAIIVNSSFDAIVGETLDGILVSWNSGAERMYGYTAEEIIGKPTSMLVPPDCVNDVPMLLEKIRQGEPVECYETIRQRKDGQRMYVLLTLSPVMDAEGKVVLVSAIAHDITGRKQAEEDLRRRTAQLEALREIGLEIAGQLEPEVLLNSIVSHAVRLLKADGGGLCLYRDQQHALEAVASVGESAPAPGMLLQRGEGLCGLIWDTGSPVVLGREQIATLQSLPPHAEAVDRMLGVPIRWNEEFLGTVWVYHYRQDINAAWNVELLNLFATQAAIALRNVVLFQAERDQREFSDALAQVAAALNSTLNFEQVLDRILEQAARVALEGAFTVLLLEGENVKIVRRWGYERMGGLKELTGDVFPIGRYRNFMHMRETGEPLLISDTAFPSVLGAPSPGEAPFRTMMRSYVGSPILLEGKVVGFLSVVSEIPGKFKPIDAERLRAFTEYAAVALRNAQLHQESMRYAEELEVRVQERTAELRTQYARLDAILRTTTSGMIVTNAKGEILQMNPVAQSWLTQMLTPEDAERLENAVRLLSMRAESSPEAELEFEGLDLRLHADPVPQPGAEGMAAVIAVNDITHLKVMERMKTHFITNVSHEFRTPVTTLKLCTELMQQHPEKRDKYLDSLADEVAHLDKLLNDVLEISRIDAGRLGLELEQTTLDPLVGTMVDEFQSMAQERDLTLTYQPADEAFTVFVDSARIARVFRVLLSNALYYTPGGGQVLVSTARKREADRDWALVSVRDTGMGIPKEVLPHLFDRFFRGIRPREMQISGTGLGLPIAKALVELHGGRLTVESRTPEDVETLPGEAGSTFTVWLPLA